MARLAKGFIFVQDQRYSTGLSSGAYGGKKKVRNWGAVASQALVVFARCAFSRSHSRHQLASSSRSRCCRKEMARGESTSRPGIKTEVQPHLITPGRYAQGGDGGDFFVMTPALVEHGGLPARCPTAAHQRGEQKAAFVQKHQPSLQPACFFLMAGHTCLTHWPMPSSSRSTALRVGFCGLQFMECNRRQT